MTTTRTNKAVVLEYVAAMNAGDQRRLRAVFHPGAAIHGVLGQGNLDFAMPIWKELHESLSMHLQVSEIIAEGDTVAVRYRETGTSVAPFRGQPATGRTFELTAIEWFTLKDGLILSRHGARDSASQARQLGWAA